MILPIRYYGDPVLRKVARPVRHFDERLKVLAQDMLETMYDASGVGLAAPQVGVSERLFIALELKPPSAETDAGPSGPEPKSAEEKKRQWGVVAEHIMVNPVITARSGEQFGQDGCLSLPGLSVPRLRRDLRVTVTYQDLDGRPQELSAEGHFAHVIQHELDHLDGILFFDRLPPAEKRAFLDEHRQALAELQREAKAFLKQHRATLRVG